MPYSIDLPDGYGRVSAIALGALPLFSFLQGLYVTTLRQKAGVIYPNAYASPQHAKESQLAYSFNCAQRAHQQYLENMPHTIVMMLFAGLEYPRETFYCACAWLGLRVVYWAGYTFSNKPGGNGRLIGGPFWFAQGAIWGLCLATSRKMW